ncbi:sugar phosphate isomerase/epimerase [Jeotgalibacillus sp. ET6]|uniref:sugar phosphate isomerase/epimerase family protein n=1 Tax=Jeotgalibacillus sp. ET6 TaxID=3037260 RepID=UPI0024182080|nr:sugar phosphate isomerase/epimerase [Jeotgalibacillus sp. ET6]MDG5472152.1 sugar phosphate isomerase/epimerase [Jeotgalibacillus sp. ET6]
MKLSLCTITYRHHLLSMNDLALFASANGFSSIELWGIHAENLSSQPNLNAEWLKKHGLTVSMISDYLPLHAPVDELQHKVMRVQELAERWQTGHIRTFAGQKGSGHTTPAERSGMVKKIRQICQWLEGDQKLLIETHPNTLADTLESTISLLQEVGHPALAINFDVLHIWEGKSDPVEAFLTLEPAIKHLHLKNIASRDQLNVFEPANVYAAAGDRNGMVSLFEGAVDYTCFFRKLASKLDLLPGSLEWFGPNPDHVLKKDRKAIQQFLHYQKAVIHM